MVHFPVFISVQEKPCWRMKVQNKYHLVQFSPALFTLSVTFSIASRKTKAPVSIGHSCRIAGPGTRLVRRGEGNWQGWGRELEASGLFNLFQLNQEKEIVVQWHGEPLVSFTAQASRLWVVCRTERLLQGSSFLLSCGVALTPSPQQTPRKRSPGAWGPDALLQRLSSHSFPLSLWESSSASKTRVISVPLCLRLGVFWKGSHKAMTLSVTIIFTGVFGGKWPFWKWFISRPSP